MGLVLVMGTVIVLAVTGVLIAWLGRRSDRQENAVKRLAKAEDLIDTVTARCIEMASVGDPTAQTILDDIRQYQRSLR